MIRGRAGHEDASMARLVPTLAISVVLLAGCGGDDGDGDQGESAATGAPSGDVEVDIASFDFMPKTVEVTAGGSITWTNQDKALHNAQTDNGAKGAFKTKDLNAGDTDKIAFEQPGTYSYYCVYHRFMTAKVEVTQ